MKTFRKVCIIFLLAMVSLALLCKKVEAAETLYWPVPGHPNLSQGLHKNAIDISDGSILGANVHAAMGGTVTHIHLCQIHHPGNYSYDTCNGFGTGLVIAGDDGRIYQYAHMQANSIPANVYRTARVEKGQLIGRVGETGAATGPHLHFGISIGSYDANSGINPDTEPYSNRYSSSKPAIPTNLLNLGDSFYAYLLMSNDITLFNVDVNSKVILQKGVFQDTKQIWKFMRQSDGSYIIQNSSTGKYLDICNSNDYDGGGIQTFTYNGSNAQRFFITGSQDRAVLRPACSQERVVSIDGGVNVVGAKLNMWEYWEVETQLFNIWKKDDEAAKPANLSYSLNNQSVKLNWTNTSDKYNLYIYKKESNNSKTLYKTIKDISGTSYNITLPNGSYEVYIENWTWVNHAYSNVVNFKIENTNSQVNGLAQVSGTWYYFKNGAIDTNYTGLVYYNSNWFYVQNGRLYWGVETLVQYNGTWYYVKNSTVDWSYTGLAYYNKSWFYVQKGQLNWGKETLVQYNGTWYYVKNSTVDWSYTGLAYYNKSWFYVQKGQLNWGKETLVLYNGTWYYVKNSTLDWNFTGICKYQGKSYYIQKGILKWGYNGTITYNGKKYNIKNSTVI